jgi:hypothetical protein
MFASIKGRREVVRALWRDVHFLGELDEVKDLRRIVLDLARQWRTRVKSPLYAENPEAVTYLVTMMSAHAIVESVVARPSHLSADEVEETFARILARLVS